MEVRETARYGPLFTISLMTSWTFVTVLIGMLGWSDQRSAERLATWAGIWIFTVAVPTVLALRVHGVLSELRRDGHPLSSRSRSALAHARALVLICGSMTVLLLFGLLA